MRRASLCGFHPNELIGMAPKLGNSADPTAAARFVECALGSASSCSTSVVNHTKDGRPFLQHLQMRKVEDGESTCEPATPVPVSQTDGAQSSRGNHIRSASDPTGHSELLPSARPDAFVAAARSPGH